MKLLNQAQLENGRYEKIVTHLENEVELKSLESLTPTKTKITANLELSTFPVRHVAKRTTPQRGFMPEPMHPTGHFPGRANREDRLDRKNRKHKI